MSRAHTMAGSLLGLAPERVFCTSFLDHQAVREDLIPGLIRQAPYLALPLGRSLEPAREAAASFLIGETARANAEFAMVSGLPAIIPIVGTVAAMGTDMVVLTKNQVMLLLKLALLYQRPIENRLQVIAEVAPVIGAAFFWRSAAQTLMTLLPGPLCLAPRGAVAFIGTYVAGKAGHYYYRWGRRPSPAVLDTFREEAVRQITGVTPLLASLGRHLRLP